MSETPPATPGRPRGRTRLQAPCRIPSRRRRARRWRAAAPGRSPRRSRPAAGRLSASRRRRRSARHDRDAVNRIQPIVGDRRPLAKRVAKHLLVRPIAVERGDDRVLHRSGAAQPSVRQLLDPGEQIVEPRRRRDRHPAGAPARRQIRLGQRRERDDRRLGIERGEGADRAIERQVRVNLVGEQREVVLVGEIDERAPGLSRNRSRRSGCWDR